MCSLSFLPHHEGFHLLMNRDEQRSRAGALPPEFCRVGDFLALYPREASGGTWIGVNEAGLTLALLNWYSCQPIQGAGVISRGSVIPALLAADSRKKTEQILKSLPLSQFNPFRLIIVDCSSRHLIEWLSDGCHLESKSFLWNRRHWFSSGYDEEKSIRERALVVQTAALEPDMDSLPWLRRLHRSHEPTCGPFSICMHREDACTVSSTEINIEGKSISLQYRPGSPCGEPRGEEFALGMEFKLARPSSGISDNPVDSDPSSV